MVSQCKACLTAGLEGHCFVLRVRDFYTREERLTQDRNRHARNMAIESEEEHLRRLELVRDHYQQIIQDSDDSSNRFRAIIKL